MSSGSHIFARSPLAQIVALWWVCANLEEGQLPPLTRTEQELWFPKIAACSSCRSFTSSQRCTRAKISFQCRQTVAEIIVDGPLHPHHRPHFPHCALHSFEISTPKELSTDIYLWILICSWALAGRQDAKGGSWLTYCLKQPFKALTFQPYPRQCNSKFYIERGQNNIQSGYHLNLFLIGIRMWNTDFGQFLVPHMMESDNLLSSWFCKRHFLKSAYNFYLSSCDAFVLIVERCLWIDPTNHGCKTPLPFAPPLWKLQMQEVSRLTFPLYQNRKKESNGFHLFGSTLRKLRHSTFSLSLASHLSLSVKLGSYFHGISEDCSRPGITWSKGQSRDIARILRPWEHETNSQVGQNIRGATISSQQQNWWKIRLSAISSLKALKRALFLIVCLWIASYTLSVLLDFDSFSLRPIIGSFLINAGWPQMTK